MGSTVSSRTNAKAARVVCHGTWAWVRPMPRRAASRTSHKVRLLAAVAAVIRQPRAAIRAPARPRKPSSAPGRSKEAPAGHPGGERERGLQRAARAERERFAAHQQAEPGGQGGEQGQAYRRVGHGLLGSRIWEDVGRELIAQVRLNARTWLYDCLARLPHSCRTVAEFPLEAGSRPIQSTNLSVQS